MKFMIRLLIIIGFSAVGISSLFSQSLTATEIVRKADEKFNGEKSSMMVMSMTIIRPTWQTYS